MNRNLITDGIILKNTKIGEIHKGISIFSEIKGIINAVAHGAAKSKGKLAGYTDPFSLITAYIYFNPVKKSYTIKDISIIDGFENIRSDLKKIYVSSFWAEVILRSFGGGDDHRAFYYLLRDALIAINNETEKAIDMVLIQFLWKYLILSGFLPDIHKCGSCGRPLDEKDEAFFHGNELLFLCRGCSLKGLSGLSPGARKYLEFTKRLDFRKAIKIGLDSISRSSIKAILIRLTQLIIEVPLKSLDSGKGVFY